MDRAAGHLHLWANTGTSLLDPSTDVQVEGLNYFFDTLLFAGTHSRRRQRSAKNRLRLLVMHMRTLCGGWLCALPVPHDF